MQPENPDLLEATQNHCCVSGWIWIKILKGPPMGEGIIKTPIPKCHLYWCFCLGWCSNFVGSKSGQKQSVKLLQNMVYNTTHPPPPHSQTQSVHTVRLLWEGVGDVREKVEGQQLKERSKIKA
jgi:hypothetical protein